MNIVDIEQIVSTIKKLANSETDIDLSDAVLKSHTSGIGEKLSKQLAALYLKRLLRRLLMTDGCTDIVETPLPSTYIHILSSASIEQLQLLVTFPTVTGFLFACKFDEQTRLSFLGNAMCDLAAAIKIKSKGPIPIKPSSRNVLELHLMGIRLVFGSIRVAYIQQSGETMLLYGSNQNFLGAIAIAENAFTHPIIRVEKIRRIGCSRITIARDDPILFSMFPAGIGTRSAALHSEITKSEVEHLEDCIEEGINLLQLHWREGYDEIISCIQRIVPLVSDGTMRPLNLSVHALRGMVAATPRRSYLSAQLLAHESGHNRLSTILDLYQLVLSSDDSPVYSPFVQTFRPPHALLHGIFSFTRDLEITRRMLERVPEMPGYALEKYHDKLNTRLKEALLQANSVSLTPAGRQVLRGCEAAIEAGERRN